MRHRSWKRLDVNAKILAMRFQALGDTIITLPYLQSLKRQYPGITLHFLTRQEVSQVPEKIILFDRVITVRGGRSAILQFLFVIVKLPFLWRQRYDAVLDLQNHRISNLLRKILMVKVWSEFNKYAPLAAGERTKMAIQALGFSKVDLDTDFHIKVNPHELLTSSNWKKDHDLVVLNPAGAFTSRNWPIDNYIAFAMLWIRNINAKAQFLLLLLPAHKEKADQIASALGDSCIDLTGKADQSQAFAILQYCKFVLSEDSGLMHMAWVQRIPTLALFSSSKKVWSAPQGEWSMCLDSSDMACGPCGKGICTYHDNRCLTRYSPEIVLSHAKDLITSRGTA